MNVEAGYIKIARLIRAIFLSAVLTDQAEIATVNVAV